MTDILFVKTSSLGDVIHHMPAVTEARRHLPGAHFAWVVEEPFAPLVRLHPEVGDVVAVASRRWRRSPLSAATWHEVAVFRRVLRARAYDEVIDTQGLLRSALITRGARGRRHGYDRHSIREPLAAAFYDVRHAVARAPHAIERNRLLTAHALGYVAAGPVDFGLARERLAVPGHYAVLLHATARVEKEWPLESWRELARTLQAAGVPVVVPWGTPAEKERSEAIAAAAAGVEVPPRGPVDAMAKLVAGAAFVVGVDTGLMHLAAALGVPLVAIFIASRPDLTGPRGSGPIAVVGGTGGVPRLAEVLTALERVRGGG